MHAGVTVGIIRGLKSSPRVAVNHLTCLTQTTLPVMFYLYQA